MKRKASLLVLAAAMLMNLDATAQINENFEPIGLLSPISSLVGAGWQFSDVNWSNSSVITNTGSVYILPATNGTVYGSINSPFQLFSGNHTLSFKYKLDKKLSTNASRGISFGIMNALGQFTEISVVSLSSAAPVTVQTFTSNFTVTPGIYRAAFKMMGSQDGNTYLYMDDISITNVITSYASGVNGIPVAVNDQYASFGSMPITGNVITNPLGLDSDPDGEKITALVVTQPATGTLTLSPDGSFTYTPPVAGFAGGLITFTYSITDDSFTPATSNVATVTLSYPAQIILPVKLVSFTGSLEKINVNLRWTVEGNETAYVFEIEKSIDGRNYTRIATVNATSKEGKESYATQLMQADGNGYYRIRIIETDNTISYSKFIRFAATGKDAVSLQLLNNPVKNDLRLNYVSGLQGQVQLRVYTAGGQIVISEKVAFHKGQNAYTLNATAQLAPGMYIIELLNGTERTAQKFIKE